LPRRAGRRLERSEGERYPATLSTGSSRISSRSCFDLGDTAGEVVRFSLSKSRDLRPNRIPNWCRRWLALRCLNRRLSAFRVLNAFKQALWIRRHITDAPLSQFVTMREVDAALAAGIFGKFPLPRNEANGSGAENALIDHFAHTLREGI